MNRAEILDEARACVTRDRAATHGEAEDSFALIAQFWSLCLGVPVSAAQVAVMMAAFKLARGLGNPAHADNWVDMAGYAALAGEIALKGDQ